MEEHGQTLEMLYDYAKLQQLRLAEVRYVEWLLAGE